ncbi:hypothetical protein A2863_03020 [Candidatus Woesebacteria bacterium RIFCSPHIGHO2_01_FULL_38_9b]|uniref:Cell envelope-related transcriptional attenuator domain-containing protein n=2 Tax=Candidatus Woeseibacteriota TaxID=1752722 RepID=A0A1F7Y243_9BACT|nr:MAG: hypothetical protein A2863_03020 [Candidatus Woesebacteria bacterium RIFCSPHIGHO2_01_FULL_38_9b]
MVKENEINTPLVQEDTTRVKRDRKIIVLSRLKRRLLKHVWLMRGLILFGIIAFLLTTFLFVLQFFGKTPLGVYMGLAKDFIFTPKGKVESYMDRTNILILGKGGEGHEAPDLTDTIMFVSVNHSNSDISIISLPRDIWITELRTKLNSVYYWGNKKQPPVRRTSGPEEAGGGIIMAKSTVEEFVGQPVHYGLVLDFSGFKKIIDILEGIEVDVENSFTDERYPIAGRENDLCEGDPEYRCRYETLRFAQGKQMMDGDTALKFVRSRNAQGDEGTDIARARHQQKVIAAIKDKVLSKEIILSPRKLLVLKDVVLESIETDIAPSAASILARRFLQSKDVIKSQVLSEELLLNPAKSPKYDNLYVFIPEDESLDQIHKWIECVIATEDRCGS